MIFSRINYEAFDVLIVILFKNHVQNIQYFIPPLSFSLLIREGLQYKAIYLRLETLEMRREG